MRCRSIVSTLLLLLVSLAPQAMPSDHATVSSEIKARTGHSLRPFDESGQAKVSFLPPGVTLGAGISEDEAIAIALWNNADLQATLADLGLARADLAGAGLFRNPSIQILFGVGPKPFEFLLQAPVEALWQRPRRVAAAKLNLQSVSAGLVQNGVNLVRDVLIAHSGLVLAEQRVRVAREAAELRQEIAELTQRRFRAGDIGELEANAASVDALMAADQAAQSQRDVDAARESLRLLLGLTPDRLPPSAHAPPPDPATSIDQAKLLDMAASSRPDLRAAELAVEAAGQRARWQRSRIVALVAPLLSTKGVGTSGVRTGPGIAAEVPVFDYNQGGRSRADAEVRQAVLRYAALLEQVESEVRQSGIQLAQAEESLSRLRNQLLPAVEKAVNLAEKAYANGDISYLELQLTKPPLYDASLREAEAVARVRQARAELERAVGRRL